MKTTFATLVAVLVTQLTASAAPRLIVSTPSLTPESDIDLILDRPVTPPGDLGKTVDNTWLEITPGLPGKLIWKAQNIASFVPDRSPTLGTTYTFAIPKGKKHLDLTEIPAGKFATAATDPFRVTSVNNRDRYSDGYSASTAEWTLIFNDDIDPGKAGPFINFTSSSGQQVAARLERPTLEKTGRLSYQSWSDRGKKSAPAEAQLPLETPVPLALIATPSSPLPVGKGWKISVLKGLPNASGTTTIPDNFAYDVGDIEPFRVTGIAAVAEADQPRKIVINFNYALPKELPANFLDDIVLISPHPANLSATVEGRQITLLGNFSDADSRNVTVFNKLTSATGFPLSEQSFKEVKFDKIEPELVLPSEDQAQLASGTRSYPIHTVNLGSIRVRVKKLSPEELVRAYQGYRNYTGVGPDYQAIQPTAPLPYSLVSGTTIYDKEIQLGNAVDTSKDITLNWNEILPKDHRTGAIFVDIIGTPHPDLEVEGKRNAQSIVQLTDIGLAWKLTSAEAFVYAFSCSTGEPIKDVAIDLFGEDSATIKTIKTDASGLAKLPRPEDARHLRAVLGTDTYITAFDSSLNTVGLWHFPIRYSWNNTAGNKRRAFLFTDRSLYRPGETVRLKGIVRDQNGNDIVASASSPARIAIVDPADQEIHVSPITISENGSFDLSYTLPAGKTGSHTIRLEFPDELAKLETLEDDWRQQQAIRSSAVFEKELRVEEFRRNAFEVEQTLAKPSNGATSVTAELSATYFQGQPVAAGKVNHYTRIAAKNFYPERFRDFLFGNHRVEDWSYWYHYFGYESNSEDEDRTTASSSSQGEATLSLEGKATIALEIPKAEFPTAREVTISSEVTDANNQTLTTSTTTTVDPAAIYVGISRNDKLHVAGKAVDLKIVATDTAGNPYPNPVNVNATITREVNTAVRSRNDSGATITRNDVQQESVLNSQLTIDPANSIKEGQPLSFIPQANGRYFVTLRGNDPEGREFATVTSFSVYGANDYPWLYEDGLRVKLVSEKKSYKAGDTARILVLSPIEGTALVTVEREKVLRSFLASLTADKPVIEIPITAEDAPNAYVSVLIVKGAASSAREFKSPQLRLGYCEIMVENERDKLAVTLNTAGPENETFTISTGGQPPKKVPACRPGEEVTLTGSVTFSDGKPAAGAELTLYAEDEGTLSVMGYETPNPFAFFYDPRMLDIEVGVSFNNFISEDPDMRSFMNKGFFIGGGGDLGKLADLYRKNFDPCATWAPVVKAGADGKFSHKFKVPDTLTRYRIIAIVHHNASKFGNAQSEIVVNKPLMLEPKSPRFANQGDTFSPQVLVQNASPYTGTWEVTFDSGKTDGTPTCSSLGEPKQTVTLNPGAAATLVFPVKAETTGEAVFSWKAVPVSLGNQALTDSLTRSLSDAVQTRFEISYPMPLIRQVKFSKLAGEQNLLDQIDPQLLTGQGDIELEFSRSPLSQISGSVDYLLSYPHGCVEQTTSSLMPWFAVNSLRSIVPAFEKTPEEKVKIAIQKGADRLLSMQLPDGSFSYWPGNTETVTWATSYAGLGLILAEKNGANVPRSAIDSLSKNLIESLRGTADVKSPSTLENHARALWILALAGHAQPAYQSVLIDRIADLSPGARAFLALAIHQSGGTPTAAKAILDSKVPFKLKDDSWMRYSGTDSFRFLALATIDPTGKETTTALDRLLNERNPYGHWNTTWANGWSLLALSKYAETEKSEILNSTVAFNPPLAAGTVTLTPENPTAKVSMKITPDLKLNVLSTGSAFVRIRVAAKPKIEPIQPVATNGLSIDRLYERIKPDGSAEILTEPKVGDLVRVSLRVSLPTDNTKYLVIEDLLPSIFETVNTDFKSQNSATGAATSANDWRVSHSELRTDRACFYLDEIWHRGTYTLTYLARCTVPGEVYAPPAKVEGMYDPGFYALSASRVFSTK